MIIHTISFKVKDQLDREKVVKIVGSMKDVVSGIESFCIGCDILGTSISYDVCCVAAMKDRDTLKAYLQHPHHENDVKPVLAQCCSALAMVDFEI
jgi:hypothetical protein